MVRTILSIVQMVLAVILIAAILLQARGTGLGTVFGGGGTIYRTKRGIEKSLYLVTIAVAILFFGVAFAHVLF